VSLDLERLKELLDDQHQWPSKYSFKFIVPYQKLTELMSLLSSGECSQKPSKNGKYISVTSIVDIKSSDEVLNIYEKASTIEGIISL